MDSGVQSSFGSIIQAIDPGHAILEVVRPALDIFRSETFAPDMSLAMTLSALMLALYFRFFRVGSACDALNIRANFLRKCTNNRIFADNFYEFDLLMKEGPFLEHGWNEFVETCLVRDPHLRSDIEITVRPADFININDAEHSGLKIKWFHELSGVYVGVGLLFTFAGLVAALYFSSAAINAVINTAAMPDGGGHDSDVQRALAQLLNTATFKFLTSIAGLGCSIVLAYLDGRWRAKIQRGFDDLCRELERCTVMVTPESIAERQYKVLGEIANLLKNMGPAVSAAPQPAPVPPAEPAVEPPALFAPPLESGPAIEAVLDGALARLESVVITASQTLAASFEQSLARHAALSAPSTTVAAPAAPPPPQPSAEAPASSGSTESAARIEAAVAAASGDLRAMVAETRGFRADLAASLGELAATLRADGDRNAALLRDGLGELTTRQVKAAPAEAGAADPVLESAQQIMARLSGGIERLTGGFDQAEGKLTAHLAAFEAITRSTREAEQAIAGTARSLQTATLPLSRASTELSDSVAAIAAGVENSVRTLLQSQEAGQRLGEDLRAVSENLQEVWKRHETRFIGVDDSVARILTTIIQHTEAHGDAVRNQVVAIDSHLAHAVNSLAANIEALHEMTATLTEAASKKEKPAAPAAPAAPARPVHEPLVLTPAQIRDI